MCGLLLLISGTGVGLLAALLALMLDDWMDYGSILYTVRLWFVKRSMRRQGMDVEATLQQVYDCTDWQQREDVFRGLAWQLALNDFWLTGWLCRVCMAARIGVLLSVGLALVLLKNGADGWLIFIAVLQVPPVAHYISKKL
jgi:hypothetical protein